MEGKKAKKFYSNEMGKMPAKNEVNIALVDGKQRRR